MAELKAHEVDRWLTARATRPPIMLVFGPDRGSVSERAKLLALESGVPLDDAFAVTRLDALEIEKDPGRLLDVAFTMAMFAGRRLIWIKNAGAQKGMTEAIKTIAASPPPDVMIVIEGGDLKKGTGIRGVVEASRSCIALPCYVDNEQSIEALVTAELKKAGIAIDDDALSVFKSSLGGDRLATRAEIDKLALYALGQTVISLDDVRSSTGDVSALSADDVVDAVISGDAARFDRMFSRLMATGGQASQLLSAMQRQIHALLALAVAMHAEKKSSSAAVAGARPPIYFGRRKTIETALNRLSVKTIAEIAGNLQNAVHETRRSSSLIPPVAYTALLAVTASFHRR